MIDLKCPGRAPLTFHVLGSPVSPPARVFLLIKVIHDNFGNPLPRSAVSIRGFFDCAEATIFEVKDDALSSEQLGSLYLHTQGGYQPDLWDRIEEHERITVDEPEVPLILYAAGENYAALKPYLDHIAAYHLRRLRAA